MKLLTIIMSLYFLALSVMPCNDTAKNIVRDSVQKEWRKDNDNHAHQDLCSPLCTCNCCKTFVRFSFKTLNIEKISLEFPIPESVFPNYTSLFNSNYYGNIWQPPKI